MGRHYNGWEIITVGGFCTLKRYIASRGEQHHWAFRLKECKEFCDLRNANKEIGKLYLTPLYT